MTNNRVLKKTNDIPIRLKFSVFYIAFVLLPMIIVYGIFFVRISGEVKSKEEVIIEQSLDRVERDVVSLLEGCFNISDDITIDGDINELLDRLHASHSEYYKVYHDELRDDLTKYKSAYNNVIRVSVYTDNPSVLAGGDIYQVNEEVKEEEWYKAYKKNDDTQTLVGWVEDKRLTTGRYSNRISLVRKMDQISQYQDYEKFLRIDIELQEIKMILENDQTMDFLVINNDNDVLVSSESQFESGDSESLLMFSPSVYAGENALVQRPIVYDGDVVWTIIGVMESSSLSRQLQNYGVLILLLFLASLGLSIIMIMLFSSSYVRRIALLEEHMVKVEKGDYCQVDVDPGKDEIGFLIKTFNSMTGQLNGLVNQVLKLEIREKEHQLESVKAELNFLQSQMDPHFLFNTLNAILVVCNRKKYNEITEILKYLSKTLRRLLVWDDSMVTIEDEIKFIEMYLKIEKFRFQDKFDYTIEVDEQVKAYKLPKMSIQPFVENACKHGIQATKEVGHVLIRAYSTDDFVIIVVKDDGIGMAPHVVDQLFEEGDQKHIGMNNVYKRLMLNYSDTFDIRVTSVIGEGTSMIIKLPKEGVI